MLKVFQQIVKDVEEQKEVIRKEYEEKRGNVADEESDEESGEE